MKTVCKKLLALMLVVMLLVSAVPTAFATEAECTHPNKVLKPELHVDATCEADGEDVYYCGDCYHNVHEVIPMLGHNLVTEVTKEATCTEAGLKTITCSNEGCTLSYTEEIPMTAHTMDGNTCTVCGYEEYELYTIGFTYKNASGAFVRETVEIRSGAKFSLPVIPKVDGMRHTGWIDGNNNIIDGSDPWYLGQSQEIYATYEADTTEDGLVDLTVYARFYVDGVFHHEEKLYTESFDETNRNTMFTWLYSDAGVEQTRNVLSAKSPSGYQWTPVIYYDYFDNGAVTEADMKSDGNKTLYIKVTSLDEIEANVLLYVHTGKTATVSRVIPLDGYTAGDYVRLADAKTAVKKYFSGNRMTISDMYTEKDWEDLLANMNSSGSASIKVADNGTTKIHIIVGNATAGGNADPTNPKTGDAILVSVATMLSSASAAAYLFLNKKRIVK